MLNVFPIRRYDSDLDCYVLSDGSYLDLIAIQSKDLVNAPEDDIQFDCGQLTRFLNLYADDLKLISMNFPVNTSVNQAFLKAKMEQTNHPRERAWLQLSISELQKLDRHTSKKEFFLMYFADSADTLDNHRNTIIAALQTGRDGLVQFLSAEKKHQILFKMNNMNTPIRGRKNLSEAPSRKWGRGELQAEEQDLQLLSRIQPQGGITFSELGVIKTGDGYVKILHIYELPDSLGRFWLRKLCNIEGAITTIDIHTEDTAEMKQTINKSLSEQLSRQRNSKNFAEAYDASKRREELAQLYQELDSMGDTMKRVHFRIILSDPVLVHLEERYAKLEKELYADSYAATVMLNEEKREWQSLYQPYRVQHQQPFYVDAHPLNASLIAKGNPFHFSDLQDEFGTFLGWTPCNGNVIFDEFAKSNTRKHYNSVAIGDMSAGKSTLLKKRLVARAARKDFVRTFDVSGEFSMITEDFGGKVIRCDGKEGMLNPLEILQAGEDERISFTRHIAKLTTFYRCHVPDASDSELIDLQNLLRRFYRSLGLVPELRERITGLSAREYPIFSDLRRFIETEIRETVVEESEGLKQVMLETELKSLMKIQKTITNITDNYGHIFNGHTSIDNIIDQRVVTFDISTIKDLGSAVFDSQLFNMLSLCWDNCVANGSIMKEKEETGAISFEDVVRFLILIDESHRWINTKKPHLLDLITVYMREARKYFGGIMLASQSIRDYVPEGKESEHIDKLKTVFELTQYKFLMHQSSNALPLLDSAFNNVLTYYQRAEIPKLGMGDVILAIEGERNLKLHVYLDEVNEKPKFKGGV